MAKSVVVMGYGTIKDVGMAKRRARSTIEFDPELVEEFSEWTSRRGRKVAPAAAMILSWFLDQDLIVQEFILAVPEVAEKLADVLMKMSMKARTVEASRARRGGSAIEANPEVHSPRRQSAPR